MTMVRRAAAEAVGTFWLVFGGCGSAVIAAAFPEVGIGLLGVSLAFGLTVLTMAYSLGHISGCHLNPAVTVGLWIGGRFPGRDIPWYVVAQVVGATVAAIVLLMIASGAPGFDLQSSGLAQNGYGSESPGGYAMASGLIAEVVLTAGFLIVILGSTDSRAPAGLRPNRHRPRADADPPGQHPDHQHIGEPGAKHRAGAARRRAGDRAAVVLLAGADNRRADRRAALQGDVR